MWLLEILNTFYDLKPSANQLYNETIDYNNGHVIDINFEQQGIKERTLGEHF